MGEDSIGFIGWEFSKVKGGGPFGFRDGHNLLNGDPWAHKGFVQEKRGGGKKMALLWGGE